MTGYAAFLSGKRAIAPTVGFEVAELPPWLFPFQRDLTRWALRKGRCAIFADTGLGKTRMQLAWAQQVNARTAKSVLVLAPLSVARQTVREAERLGVDAVYARAQEQAGEAAIVVTNYEMMEHFDVRAFGGVVLDESSILKATEGVYRNLLIERFAETPYRLCCTATPAPNDIQEITNHSAFLGIMPRRDVLATFFLHEADDARASGWRLKGHAEPAFWRWMASWGMSIKHPSDLGYEDEGYLLPPLDYERVLVDAHVDVPGRLFPGKLRGVTERAAVRRQTLDARVMAAVDLIAAHPDEPWIAWCGLNDEQDAITAALGERAISVYGNQSPEDKAERLEAFIASENAVLVTKVAIAGFGMNFQHCARMAFVGIGDSYEQYYQAVRRCWRYGQTRPVHAHVVLSDIEQDIYENVLRKEREAEHMAKRLVEHVAAYERAEIGRIEAGLQYEPDEPMRLPAFVGVR